MRSRIGPLTTLALRWLYFTSAFCFALFAQISWANTVTQSGPSSRRQLGGRPDFTWEQLPTSPMREDIQRLKPLAQQKATEWLRSFAFPVEDVGAMRSDRNGGIFYVCTSGAVQVSVQSESILNALAAVPITPFPTQLVFHSRPGSPNTLYLNFAGATVTNSEWTNVVGRLSIPALAFNTDSDVTTFSDAEQVAIKRIWQRVSEDYAPFDIDVTTARPVTFNTRTAHALITRSTDANGDPNPYSSAGGVAYVNVFGLSSYDSYRPAWIYYDNLANNESYIAEAAAHEVGHNLGLSHDGRTNGEEYYGGHGSGDISWGPIMGTGYNRNVSQWSKGEYYLANNTQDDIATIAGKITYRGDDFGNTLVSATALVLTGNTNLVSTTPENDPTNTNTANKGVIERNMDVDVFSFVTGNGPVSLAVKPWIMSADTRGGDLDVRLELYNETGTLLVADDPASLTTAAIATNLSQGRYFLQVRPSSTGDPFNSTPTGYTLYGSLGQYFISGYLTAVSNFISAPQAEFQGTNLVETGRTNYSFAVSYSDDTAIDVSTIDSQDIRVTGPNGYDRLARFVSLNLSGNGSPRIATYVLVPPAGDVWTPVHNGTYTVTIQTNAVADTDGAAVAAGPLGHFQVAVPVVVYSAPMDEDPGWTLAPQWQYGKPAYASSGPTSGFSGTNIIGYNLSGNYANNLSVKYATTPIIDTTGNSTLTLRFERWLRIRSQDTVSIEVSTNATTWRTIWSTSGTVSDNAWQMAQYTLPGGVAGSSTVRLRWSIRSNNSQNDIGWNLDDVELLGDASVDATPPTPTLSIADLTIGGSPSHSCSVQYRDDTAVRWSSLDSADLLVTGPNNYSNQAVFAGADLPGDGSPINVAYSIPAPGGSWSADDNGRYLVTLLEGAVEDTLNNVTPRTELGSFDVAIIPPPHHHLSVTVNNPAWGGVTPADGDFVEGTTVDLMAAASNYFTFVQWQGDLSGSTPAGQLTMDSDKTVEGIFGERLTALYSIPYWWMAQYGFTNNIEQTVESIGANRMTVWESYIAGLNPTDPTDVFVFTNALRDANGTFTLLWRASTGRCYQVFGTTNINAGFDPVDGASNLTWPTSSYTIGETNPAFFYRLGVSLQ